MKVAVVGASGYVGAELVRQILLHPELTLGPVMARSAAGSPLASVFPGLSGFCDAVLEPFSPERLRTADVVALATPHGVAQGLVPELGTQPILDLSRDHRHAPGWVYGQPELAGEALIGAERVANPGCFATAIGLSIAPYVQAELVRGPIHVTGLTGSTGSGVTPKTTTHHPARFANVRAYKVLTHQHVPEIRGFLSLLGTAPHLDFVPQSGPFDRGIFTTCFIPVDAGVDAAAVMHDFVAPHPQFRWRDATPELKHVRGTGFFDVSVRNGAGLAVVLAAIDNLGRGAASQAIQCLEHMGRLAARPAFPPLLP